MAEIILAGEDTVTKACLKKIINYCDSKTIIANELPARGGQIKSMISNLNLLSSDYPVILLIDLDNNDCAPSLKNALFENIEKSDSFIFNIACDEAEAWLMSDRENFSNFFKIPLELIPEKRNIGTVLKPCHELDFKYKSSLFFTKELITKSSNEQLIQMIKPKLGSSKGPEYNLAVVPFIEEIWDIEIARLNSDSLNKAIIRICNVIKQHNN